MRFYSRFYIYIGQEQIHSTTAVLRKPVERYGIIVILIIFFWQRFITGDNSGFIAVNPAFSLA